MTAADLRAWIEARGLSQVEAARLLGLSAQGLRNQIYGRAAVGRQTERIIELLGERSAEVGGEA